MQAACSQAASPVLRHSWNTASDFLYSHGKNKSGVLNAAEAEYLGSHYAYHTGGNCDGAGSFTPLSHEKAASVNALALRKTNPTMINFLYYVVHSVREIGKCSDFDVEWNKAENADWRLKDDAGNWDGKEIDCRVPSYQTAILDHLMTFLSQKDTAGKPLFTGMYSDGMGNTHVKNATTNAAVTFACQDILRQLQSKLDAKGDGQLVVINGLDTLDTLPLHVINGAGSMVDHTGALQFVNTTTGDWIPAMMQTLLFDVIRARENDNRTLQIKTWPGTLTAPMTWGKYTRDTPPAELQKMIGEQFNNALALFLLVAEDNMWFGYSWFWNLGDFIPTATLGNPDEQVAQQSVPTNFFPELDCPIGKPLTPPTKVPGTSWQFTRLFEHAVVHADLANQSATRVTFTTDC